VFENILSLFFFLFSSLFFLYCTYGMILTVRTYFFFFNGINNSLNIVTNGGAGGTRDMASLWLCAHDDADEEMIGGRAALLLLLFIRVPRGYPVLLRSSCGFHRRLVTPAGIFFLSPPPPPAPPPPGVWFGVWAFFFF
jgi:hypothetical protein